MKDKGCKSHDGHLSCHPIIMSERDGWDRRWSQIKCQRLTHHGPCECQLFSLNSWINEYRTWLEFFKRSRSFTSHFTAQVCATKCGVWLLEHRTVFFMYCMLFRTPPPPHLRFSMAWHQTEAKHSLQDRWRSVWQHRMCYGMKVMYSSSDQNFGADSMWQVGAREACSRREWRQRVEKKKMARRAGKFSHFTWWIEDLLWTTQRWHGKISHDCFGELHEFEWRCDVS